MASVLLLSYNPNTSQLSLTQEWSLCLGSSDSDGPAETGENSNILSHAFSFFFFYFMFQANPLNWIPKWLTRSWRFPMMDCRWRRKKALWRRAILQRDLVALGAMGQQEIYSLTAVATTGRWSWGPPHGEWIQLFLPPVVRFLGDSVW